MKLSSILMFMIGWLWEQVANIIIVFLGYTCQKTISMNNTFRDRRSKVTSQAYWYCHSKHILPSAHYSDVNMNICISTEYAMFKLESWNTISIAWIFCQIRKIADCACAANAGAHALPIPALQSKTFWGYRVQDMISMSPFWRLHVTLIDRSLKYIDAQIEWLPLCRHLTIHQHWFRYCLGVGQVTSLYTE